MKNIMIFAVLFAMAHTANANVITVDLYHGGFSDGAFVSGALTGEDSNGNGILEWRSGDAYGPGIMEITDFFLDFSGNSILPAFSNIGFDVYDGSVSLNLSTFALTLWSQSTLLPEYDAAAGTLTDFDHLFQMNTDTSSERAQFSIQVPAPATLSLLITALLGLQGHRLRRQDI